MQTLQPFNLLSEHVLVVAVFSGETVADAPRVVPQRLHGPVKKQVQTAGSEISVGKLDARFTVFPARRSGIPDDHPQCGGQIRSVGELHFGCEHVCQVVRVGWF